VHIHLYSYIFIHIFALVIIDFVQAMLTKENVFKRVIKSDYNGYTLYDVLAHHHIWFCFQVAWCHWFVIGWV